MAISTAVDASAVARVLGIKTEFKNLRGGVVLLPQRVALVGQGSTLSVYSTTKLAVTSANQVGTLFGFGSPLHLAAKQLIPANGDGIGTIPLTVYPLEDDGSGVASAGDIAPTGDVTAQSVITVKVNNILATQFVASVDDSVATLTAALTSAINGILDMPVVAVDSATSCDLTSKWKGASANDIYIEVEESATSGVTWTVTQPVNGAVNPDVDTALDQVGNVWETLILNCMDIADTATLDKFETFGQGRWGALVRKPCIVFTGTTESSATTAIVIPEARKGTDRVNGQLVSPASNDLPLIVAARQLARIAVVANNKPAWDYGSRQATGLTPGADGSQWDNVARELAVKGGSSTTQVVDGVVNLSDTVTFYHPTGEEPPAYRYVCDIVKLMNVLFNLDLIYATAEWDGAPLVPNSQSIFAGTGAKKPKMATADSARMVDSLALNAILSNPEEIKATIESGISGTNPKRLDQTMTVQLAGNSNIISIDLNFGFNFGTESVI